MRRCARSTLLIGRGKEKDGCVSVCVCVCVCVWPIAKRADFAASSPPEANWKLPEIF